MTKGRSEKGKKCECGGVISKYHSEKRHLTVWQCLKCNKIYKVMHDA